MDETACRTPPDREHADQLERELLTLSAHIDAATWRFLSLLTEFDSAGGWSGDGVCSCAHWLNWKCGISMSAAHDKVRVAHALPRLPKIGEALRTGEVSYSKVRAMTRVATPENEDYLLELARHGTASHMERIVRGYRRATGEAERALAEERHRARTVRYYRDPEGCIVIEARLPVELGERVVSAIESAVEALEAEAGASAACDDVPTARDDDPHARWAAEALASKPPMGERYRDADGDSTEDGGEAVDNYSAEDSAAQDRGAEDTRPSVLADAAMRGALRKVARAGLLGEPDPTPSMRRADALVLVAETVLTGGCRKRPPPERHQLVVHVDIEALADVDAPGRCRTAHGAWLAAHTARRLGCDATLVGIAEDDGHPLDVGRRTRTISPQLRRALEARDRGCRFPGCTRTRHVEGHHVRHWAAGGETKLSNLVSLCWAHHRLVHEGGFTVEAVATRGAATTFRFRRPDGTRLEAPPRTEPVDERAPGDVESLNADLDIDHRTNHCLWDDVRVDLAMAVDGLIQRAPPTATGGYG